MVLRAQNADWQAQNIVPLYSRDAERAVLGDIILDPKAIEKIDGILMPDDFYVTTHKKIYQAALTIHRSGIPIDIITLSKEMERTDGLGDIDPKYLLTELASQEVSASLVPFHAQVVIEKSIWRRRQALAMRMIENSRNGTDENLHSEIMKELNDINLSSAIEPVQLSSLPVPEPISYIVEQMLPEGFPTNLYGDSGQGKSLVALRIAASIVTGTPFLGKNVKKGNVLYLDWELDENVQNFRWRSISLGMGYPSALEGLYYRRMRQPFHVEINRIISWYRKYNPVLIIIDSVGKALADDPLDAEKVINMYSSAENLGTVLMIDHQAKPTGDSNYSSIREFGSSYKRNLARSSWQIQYLESREQKSGYILRNKKNNFGKLEGDINYEIEFGDGTIKFENIESSEMASKPLGVRSSILNTLERGEATSKQIIESLDGEYDDGAIRNELSALKRDRKVIITGKKSNANIYGLPSSQSPPYKDMNVMNDQSSMDEENEERPF